MPLKYQVAMDHKHIPSPPAKNIRLWRFVSLAKFLNLLTTQSLYFTQLDVLRKQDPFEGSCAALNKLVNKAILESEEVAKAFYKDNYDSAKSHLSLLHDENAEKTLDVINSKTHYVSCWHISEYEPAGFWKLYSNDYDGIAICSSLSRIEKSLEEASVDIFPGTIEYVDYDASFFAMGNGFARVFRKRNHFSLERELRLCIMHSEKRASVAKFESYPNGISVKCNIQNLIDQVVIGPASEAWIFETLKAIITSIGFDFDIQKSKLFKAP